MKETYDEKRESSGALNSLGIGDKSSVAMKDEVEEHVGKNRRIGYNDCIMTLRYLAPSSIQADRQSSPEQLSHEKLRAGSIDIETDKTV